MTGFEQENPSAQQGTCTLGFLLSTHPLPSFPHSSTTLPQARGTSFIITLAPHSTPIILQSVHHNHDPHLIQLPSLKPGHTMGDAHMCKEGMALTLGRWGGGWESGPAHRRLSGRGTHTAREWHETGWGKVRELAQFGQVGEMCDATQTPVGERECCGMF